MVYLHLIGSFEAVETYMNNCLRLEYLPFKVKANWFLKNVEFDYDMSILYTDLQIFQFCIFGNDTNKANIRKIFSFFCFLYKPLFLKYETLSLLLTFHF